MESKYNVCSSNNNNVLITCTDLPHICFNNQDLPEDQKARYKTLAKNTKFTVETSRKTGLGESLNEIERAQQKKQEFIDNMKDYISSITRAAKEHNSKKKYT